ncbi:MAG: sigma-70 family RNA polymerase sigma factor [Acidimicrobiia bacterium]|nr:sigma-70 family RNA polymerase sigma factor [Acidimicrobiia bacterium]
MNTTTEFEELVETESRGLIAAVSTIVGDQHRAEEIVQEAFERGYRRWRRVSRLDRPGAWVRRVAINEAISVTRRRTSEQRALARVEGLADRAAAPDPLATLDDESVWAEVRRLPKDQAAVIALRYGADLGIDDIADTMHVTPAAVKSLLHRARAALRASSELQSYTE